MGETEQTQGRDIVSVARLPPAVSDADKSDVDDRSRWRELNGTQYSPL